MLNLSIKIKEYFLGIIFSQERDPNILSSQAEPSKSECRVIGLIPKKQLNMSLSKHFCDDSLSGVWRVWSWQHNIFIYALTKNRKIYILIQTKGNKWFWLVFLRKLQSIFKLRDRNPERGSSATDWMRTAVNPRWRRRGWRGTGLSCAGVCRRILSRDGRRILKHSHVIVQARVTWKSS